ncbi:MAG: hypothetical protein AB7M12_13330 [Hyphomonadaceae bacterium]
MKLKVPKKIAGVKVPKKLRGRDPGPGQRELAAAALIAVAGALLSNKKVRKTLVETSGKVAKQGVKAAGKARDTAADLSRYAIDAAGAAADRIATRVRERAPTAAAAIRRPRATTTQ